jgi:hypothetical protein
MSNETCMAGSKVVAAISHRIVSNAILTCSDNIAEGVAVGLSATAAPLMILAGMFAKSFYEAKDGENPVKFASDDAVLFAALLASRSIMVHAEGCAVNTSVEVLADALADFSKLRPLVKLEAVIRPDLLALAKPQSADALLSGILSKRLDS